MKFYLKVILVALLLLGLYVQMAVAESAAVISSFAFMKADNVHLTEDVVAQISNDTIRVDFTYMTDITRLIPTFAHTADSVMIDTLQLRSAVDNLCCMDTLAMNLLCADTVNSTYCLIVKNYDTGLPIVYLNTENHEPIISKEDYLVAEMTIDGVGQYSDLASTLVEIKGRGNSTWNWAKKPYAIKMFKKTKSEILDMPKHRKWVLLANYIDRTLIRNITAFKISEAVQMDWTSRARNVEVVLNGKHNGNYVLCEKIEIDENRVNIAEMDSADVAGDSLTGGYLLELDTYYDEVNKFKSDIRQLPVNIKDPDEDVLVDAQFNYIKNYFNDIERNLSEGNYAAAYEKMDLNSFIDFMFVYELAENGEPWWPKSSYMYKDRGGVLKAGPVWDFDYYTFTREDKMHLRNAMFYFYMFNDPYFVAQVKKRWMEHRERLLAVVDFIEEQKAYLEKTEQLNFAIWPIDDRTLNSDEHLSHVDAIDRLKENYIGKFNFMDDVYFVGNETSTDTTQERAIFSVFGRRKEVLILSEINEVVRIYTPVGLLCHTQKITSGETRIPLNKGVYFVRIETESYKIIVQ